jgi:glycosyltransferase involved in cell wall biosynthesis
MVRNEEEKLAACLQSAVDLVDEVIVVDTGSTDGSGELAAKLGARVFEFPWIDDFAAARNECIRHATGDFIFWMDADEVIDSSNREKLRLLFNSLPRRGDTETGRHGEKNDTETGRHGDRETRRHGDRGTRRPNLRPTTH